MSEDNANEIDRFEIGGENLLSKVSMGFFQTSNDTLPLGTETLPREELDDIRVRIGTLLKTETVSFLLGAGASVDCGGQLIGLVPLAVERDLHRKDTAGTTEAQVAQWLKVFYLAVSHSGGGDTTPVSEDEIRSRQQKLEGKEVKSLLANFEQVLATLHRWRSALPSTGGRLRVDSTSTVTLDANAEDLDECLRRATRALAIACNLPTEDKEGGISTYKAFIRKLLTRPLNLKRVNIFTLNYDTLVEQASDADGVVLLDGFVGTYRRVFRPESYEQDLYFPAETTEGRVHRFDRVLHLYKLHGSITWRATKPSINNPYGIESERFNLNDTQPVLIYPTPAKYGETLGMPYAELFRRFAAAVVRPQSVLFVIGYGFGDEHVNAIIRQALAVPSFTIVIVDPAPNSDFVKALRKQNDPRVWISEGSRIGTFEGFVKEVLPDLREEEILKKVVATHQSLSKKENTGRGDMSDDN
ncbi:conserved hypothetical protein [uncultured spirochete]|jgi:hypothetical protein|uniref:Uncharacterized protein n=1 Tax=uncultured spirochete TaxID=156406 RepID=A0A3P3XH55_9SPIR|nr:SIR2 family protein [Rectinema subterraneum]SLM11710.1 conserved hypothetical protein [uncultured spirochete]HBE47186.1 hypothetical protein [Spirochaetaceae bacterium]